MLRKTLLVAALMGWLLSACFPWASERYGHVLQAPAQGGPLCGSALPQESDPLHYGLVPGWDALELAIPEADLWIDVPILWIIAAGAWTTALVAWGAVGSKAGALSVGAGLQLIPMLMLAFGLSPWLGADLELRTGSWLAIASAAATDAVVCHFFICQSWNSAGQPPLELNDVPLEE